MNPLYEIGAAARRARLWHALALEDIRQRFHQTYLGIFWLAISFTVFIGIKYIIFSSLNTVSNEYFTGWLVIGYLVWLLINSLLIESCHVFIAAKYWIRGTRLPLPIYAFQSVWRETMLWTSSVLAGAGMLLYLGWPKSPMAFAALAAVPLYLLTGLALQLLLGTLSAGARDLTQAVRTVMRAAYFLTPIIWVPSGRPQLEMVALYNPFTHYIALMREPILNDVIPWTSWWIALGCSGTIWVLALIVYSWGRNRIIYWI